MEQWRNELCHFGIPGMKWGIRRYQNSDGSLTPAGKKRYGSSDGVSATFVTKHKPKDNSNSANIKKAVDIINRDVERSNWRLNNMQRVDPSKAKGVEMLAKRDNLKVHEKVNRLSNMTAGELERELSKHSKSSAKAFLKGTAASVLAGSAVAALGVTGMLPIGLIPIGALFSINTGVQIISQGREFADHAFLDS